MLAIDINMNQITIVKDVTIPPHKLHIYDEYIEKELRKLEGKNYSSEVGYIYKVIDILKIEYNTIVKNNFTGSIVYKVTFEVENCNPESGSELECTIIQNNSILLASSDPMKIIIIDEQGLPKIEIGEKVNVYILVTEINLNMEYIKVVARFLNKCKIK